MSQLPREENLDLEIRKKEIAVRIEAFLVSNGLQQEKIAGGKIRTESVLYLVYWHARLRNNPQEQARIREYAAAYLGRAIADPAPLAGAILENAQLQAIAKEYVEKLLVPVKTVDLVITKKGAGNDKSALCIERDRYPRGLALPGGIIKDEDEDNELGLPAHVFAALRVAGEKVLGIAQGAQYHPGKDHGGRAYFLVRAAAETPAVLLYGEDEGGYHFRENLKSVLRPADPRHIVDTVGFRCELVGEPHGPFVWRTQEEIMSPKSATGGFAFGHHREIYAHIIAQTSIQKELALKERDFIRGIISQPYESYCALRAHFAEFKDSPLAPFAELFPVVNRLLSDMFSENINALCRSIPIVAGIRDKAVISLRHVSLKNRVFCPYLPTLLAIAEAIAFFDLVARQKKGFYDAMSKDRIVEHDPKHTPYASYHMYRYKYRFDELMGMVPGEIVIPTFEELSVTDLMRVRVVPIRFVGLARDFLYVDEFEQSPEEFFMHDCNHSWRMISEDRRAERALGLTPAALTESSNAFMTSYLRQLRILPTDSEEERELKKLKKIILFEIVHEDAKPFLKEIIGEQIQMKEGGAVPFEVPHIDPKTGHMDVTDTLDTGISTLSYVRNKLQHGFYDHIDAQLPQLVATKYRSAEWIARAAYDMLVELGAPPSAQADLDSQGHTSYEWLLRRTCAGGPDNIHGTEAVDPTVERYGDGAERLNPKRYQAGI